MKGCEIWSLTLREERRSKVFENKVLMKIFGPKKDEVTGERIKVRTVEFYDQYSLPNIIRVIKSRIMRLAGHVERMGGRKVMFRIWRGDLTERDHLQALDVDGTIILK